MSAIRISQVVAFSRTHSVHLNPQIEGTENACPQFSGGRFCQVVARTGLTVIAMVDSGKNNSVRREGKVPGSLASLHFYSAKALLQCTRVHTHTRTHARTHAHTRTRTHTHTHAHTHARTHTHMHTHTCIHTCMHTHMHTHTDAYTHVVCKLQCQNACYFNSASSWCFGSWPWASLTKAKSF